MWKEQVDESKRKRKRDDESGSEAKKPKAESASGSKSPAVKSPKKEDKTESKKDVKEEGKEDKEDGREKSKTPETLVTIEHGRTKPRTAKDDRVAELLRADSTEAATEPVRDKCVVMIYDALASDSNACECDAQLG